MRSLHLIVNPNAGRKQGLRCLPRIITRLNRAGYACIVFVTEKRGDATDYVRREVAGADLLVACGGDGTLNEVLSGLLSSGRKIPVGYLPCGSTNDFAGGLGLPAGIPAALDHLLDSEPRPLDLGQFGENRFFSYTASFGAFTQVSWATPQQAKNILGHAAYILEGIRSLTQIRPVHMKVTANGETEEDDYIFGAVCNSTSLGGVLKLEESEVHMNDGLFEALLIPYPPNLGGLNRIIAALRGHRYDDPSLRFLRAPSYIFEGDPSLKWTLDGEEADAAPSLTVRNLPGAVLFRG